MALEKASGASVPRIAKATAQRSKSTTTPAKSVASKPVSPTVKSAPVTATKTVTASAVPVAKKIKQPTAPKATTSAPMTSAIREASAELAKMADATPVQETAQSAIEAAAAAKETTERLMATAQDTVKTTLDEAPKAVAKTAEIIASTTPYLKSAPILGSLPKFRGYDLAAFGKAGFGALVEANSLLTKGIEAISKEIFDHSVSSFESAAAATSALLGAKTFKDVVGVNATFTTAEYEKLMAMTTKIGEMTMKVAAESAGAIKARATEVIGAAANPTT